MLKKLLLISVFALAISEAASAQLAQFKALYLYNFAKNVGWPESDAGKDFVITVIGDSELAAELDKLSTTRKVGLRSVVVKQANGASSAEDSQIIFLGSSKSTQISTLVSAHNADKTLIISDKKGQCSSGASISFTIVDGKLKYEISNNNIKRAGLSITARIIQLGIDAD